MRNLVRNTLLTLVLAAAAAPLAAQEIRPLHQSGGREGMFFGIGLSSAKASIDCSGCTDVDDQTFPGIDLRIGKHFNSQWGLGLEISGHRKSDGFLESDAVDETVGDLNLSAYWYPSASGNFWLQGGVTAVVFKAEDDASNSVTYTGPGLTVGAGYDFRVGSSMSITPSIRAAMGGEGDIKDQDDNVVDDTWKTSFIAVGVAVMWH